MTSARRDIVEEGVDGTYHCTNRCVRRAHLCGVDKDTGKNYEHRKDWIRNRLIYLSDVFVMDILSFAVMDNHLHIMIRTNFNKLASLSDREILRRWKKLFPKKNNLDDNSFEPTDEELKVMQLNTERMKEIRRRMGDVSWFMKSVDEYIAREANKEDDVTGCFWEGRFSCERAMDEGATLNCAIYIDLNPIRAGIYETPEESQFTSVYERIHEKTINTVQDKLKEQDALGPDFAELNKRQTNWLAPIDNRKSERGFLSMDFEQYLTLLEWTGQQIRTDKRGAIPSNILPILERLKIRAEQWVDNIIKHGEMFHRVVGNKAEIRDLAARRGKHWFKGYSAAKQNFM